MARLRLTARLAAAWVVGCVFAGCEWARANLLIPTPWALTAHSQAPGSIWLQTADLAGPFGFALLAGAVNAAIAGSVSARLRTSHPWRARAGVAAGLLAALAYGQHRLAQDFDDGARTRVALVQGAIEPELRFRAEFRSANFARHLELSTQAAARHPRLILWPEFAAEFYLREATPQRAELERFARESGIGFVVGAPDYRFTRRATEYFNSVFVLEDGVLAPRYDKVHLMPFSETNPLRAFVAIGEDFYTAGRDAKPVATRAGRLGMLLCSEAMLPGHAGELTRAGAELLVNPTNDGWFRDRGAARQQLAAVALRAIENRRSVLRPAASGYTAVIDPHGRVVAEAPFGVPAILEADVATSRATTPYQAWGDAAVLGPAALALAWTFISLLRPGRRTQETPRMRPRTPTRLILALALLLPAVASRATAPGSMDARERLLDTVQSVCANNPTQVCTTQLEGSFEFDPAQCPATPAPQECVIDFLPDSEIRTLLTVISDDPTPADTTNTDVRIGVLLEFQIGEKHFVIAELFTPGAKIADWFPIALEEVIFGVANSFYATNGGFQANSDIGKRLIEIAVAELGLPASSIPTLVAVDLKTPELEVHQSGATQGTGSVARYRATFRFARPAP